MKTKQLTLILWLLLAGFLFSQSVDTVYVTRTGTKYHKRTCRYLKSVIPMTLTEAIDKGYDGCSFCYPKKSTTAATKADTTKSTPAYKKKSNNEKPKSYSTRCLATTKKGTQCKRNASPGSNYCWQHK